MNNKNQPQPQSRRIFRGRGGPNDRRLPKHNARRRRPHPTTTITSEVVDEAGAATTVPAATAIQAASFSTPLPTDPSEDKFHGEESSSLQEMHWRAVDSNGCDNDDCQKGKLDEDDVRTHNPCLEEIQHLKQRVRNVQESIQTSTLIVEPTVYQANVLNAVRNLVNEWRSIVRHYSLPSASHTQPQKIPTINNVNVDNNNKDDGSKTDPSHLLSPPLVTEMGLQVFQLIQLSLQSGPLAGAKPGYLKRCGSSVANIVQIYLEDVVPAHADLGTAMGFSINQMNAMQKWKVDAAKASKQDKPPSKSVLKEQHRAAAAGQKKAKKRL